MSRIAHEKPRPTVGVTMLPRPELTLEDRACYARNQIEALCIELRKEAGAMGSLNLIRRNRILDMVSQCEQIVRQSLPSWDR